MTRDKDKVFCHLEDKWISLQHDTYLENDNVKCLFCDAHLGYFWDVEEWNRED